MSDTTDSTMSDTTSSTMSDTTSSTMSEVDEELQQLKKFLFPIVTQIQEINDAIGQIFSPALDELKELENELTKNNCSSKELMMELSEVIYHSILYCENAAKMLQYCSETTLVRVQEDLRTGQPKSLCDFLSMIKRLASKSEDYHNEWKCYTSLSTKLLATIAQLEDTASTASSKKREAIAVGAITGAGLTGGAVAGTAAVVGGIGAAVTTVAGIFSFGLAVPIGVAITGGAVAATTAVGGAVTIAITATKAMKYKKIAEKCHAINHGLENLQKWVTGLNLNMTQIKGTIKSTTDAVDDMEHFYHQLSNPELTCDAIQVLMVNCEANLVHISRLIQEIREKHERIKKQIEETI